MRVLAGDIGGTKTLLRLIDGDATVREQRFESDAYETFSAMLGAFISPADLPINAACFAVAGPVLGDTARVTNLTWEVSATHLAREFAISNVALVNDFFAVARGVPLLKESDLVSINRGSRDSMYPIAILGAGTGLGEAVLIPVGEGWKVIASEGGHTDFAPRDSAQIELLAYLIEKYGHVSYERVVSGHGISNIYEHLTGETIDAAIVAQRAAANEEAAVRAFSIFVDAYGAEAGNLALKVLARGGVYLAGGVGAKNQQRLTDGRFMEAFADKGRFSSLMREIPVDLITNEQVGLLGAEALAKEVARRATS